MFLLRYASAALALAALFLFIAPQSLAQEQSVKPGINDNFKSADLDVDEYVGIFEGEDRAIFAHRHDIVEALNLEPGMDVADIGAGTGFFSRMFAPHVGPKGKVFAVDIAENFVKHIKKTAKDEGIKNLKAVLCDDHSVKLKKNSVDLVFICDVYHHFEFPVDSLASIHKALRPGGTLVIVDFERVKGVSEEWVLGHVRCGKGTVTDEVKDAGFDFIEEVPMMEGQYVRKFKKRD